MPHTVDPMQSRVRILRGIPLLLVLGLVLGALAPTWTDAAPATTITHGSRDRPLIALTFDDNFYPSRSLSVFSVLRRYDVPATMFVTGIYVSAYQEINQGLVDGGFEIADHSMTHPFLSKLSWGPMLTEIGGGTERFAALTGARTAPLMRPPYGATSSLVAEAAGAKGFQYVVLWDVDSSDWQGLSAAIIRDNVVRNAQRLDRAVPHVCPEHRPSPTRDHHESAGPRIPARDRVGDAHRGADAGPTSMRAPLPDRRYSA